MHGHQQPLSLESAFAQYTQQSGSGSTLAYAKPYITFLTAFLARRGDDIRHITDVGCGDLVIMAEVLRRLEGFGHERPAYLGLDALHRRVELNKHTYPEMECHVMDGRQVHGHREQGLLVCKDVLQHWTAEDIQAWLTGLHTVVDPVRFKYALITNCARGEGVNTDIVMGDWRPVDLTAEPFNVGQVVYSWDTKDVVLLRF